MPHRPDPASDPTAALRAHLVADGHLDRDSAMAPLSGGRTNRLWRVRGASGDLVVKLYAGTDSNPLFGNDPEAEARMLAHLDGSALAPRPRAALATPLGAVLIYTHVPGAPWRDEPASVARALSRLHRLAPPLGLQAAPDGSAALASQTRAILARCPADAAAPLLSFAPSGSVSASGVRVLLHGDAVPGNLICQGVGDAAQVTLIDWQCPALGDPVHDLAIFLSPAMQQVYRGAPLTGTEVDRFLDACDDTDAARRYRELAPWFHWRMAAYCLWRVSRGAPDYGTALDLELASLGAWFPRHR